MLLETKKRIVVVVVVVVIGMWKTAGSMIVRWAVEVHKFLEKRRKPNQHKIPELETSTKSKQISLSITKCLRNELEYLETRKA